MTRSADAPRRWTHSLKTKLIVLLTIALLPLGSIAVFQTVSVIRDADTLAARDILARTDRAASEQEAIVRRAFGAASGLGASAVVLRDDVATCNATMERFVNDNSEFVFAGFVPETGVMTCSSTGAEIDFSAQDDWVDFVGNRRPLVTMNPSGSASQQPVLVIFTPIFNAADESFVGGQAISIPHGLTDILLRSGLEDVALALLDNGGDILATSSGMDETDQFTRLNIRPSDLAIPSSGILLDRTGAHGAEMPVALVPLIPGQIYVVGLWRAGSDPYAISFLGTTAPVFPILMWLASLLVAFLAVNRLVLRHLSHLSRQMADFSVDSAGGSFTTMPDAPVEIRSIANSYNTMIDHVMSDHRTLQDNLQEKELLLREVHHRVKNNLQLISSILNMQMRGVESKDARRILKRVQDRVMSLSTIHKALYSGSRVDAVRADQLLQEIVSGVLNVGLPPSVEIQLDVTLGAVTLDPDQAVPLSLLATEALTNATKYVGVPADGTAAISLDLQETDDGIVTLLMSNSRGVDIRDQDDIEGSGLGAKLIEAFASQLGGDLTITPMADLYQVAVVFEKIKMEA